MRRLLSIGLLIGLAACAGTGTRSAKDVGNGVSTWSDRGTSDRVQPWIETRGSPLQCVPFARAASGIEIYGDAWTWWDQAKGRYRQSSRPQEGAVMVLSTDRKRGHLAVVSRVLGPRRIVVEHANWLNRGQIHRDTPVVDVSDANDWSAVRVWYTPGNQLGTSTYPVVGFIHPEPIAARN